MAYITKKRMSIIGLIVALICSSFIVSSSVIAEENRTEADAAKYIQVQVETMLYATAGQEPIGQLEAGAQFVKTGEDDDWVAIQWGDQDAYIAREAVTDIEEKEMDESIRFVAAEEIELRGQLRLLDKELLTDEDGEKIAFLQEGVEVGFSENRDGAYEVIVGNRVLLLSEESVEVIEDERADRNEQDENEASTDETAEPAAEVNAQAEEKATENTMPRHTAELHDFSTGYFEATETVTVYDNSTGKLVPVGTLEKGQVYPIVSDYGNWHRIEFHEQYGYVSKSATRPAHGDSLHNESDGKQAGMDRDAVASQEATVYDNSSGSLVAYATLHKGTRVKLISDYGNWWRVEVAGRIGFVYKSAVAIAFKKNDRYFEVIADNVTVYDNSSGSLVPVGRLEKGEVYPRVSDYGNWHRIQFHNKYGYVRKEATQPATGKGLKNEHQGEYSGIGRKMIAEGNVTVYDNTSGQLVPYAVLSKGTSAPILSDYGNWWRVEVADRIGYVRKYEVSVPFRSNDRYFKVIEDNIPIYSKGQAQKLGELKKGQVYPRTSDYGPNWHEIQFAGGKAYVYKRYTHPVNGNNLRNESPGNLRYSGKTFLTSRQITVNDNSGGKLEPFALLETGVTYPILGEYGNWWSIEMAGRIGYIHKASVAAESYKTTRYDTTFEEALNKQMAVNPQTDLYSGYWQSAKKEDVAYYLNPDNFKRGTNAYYQFLVLSGTAGVPKSEFERILAGKGILADKADSFMKAGQQHNINEVYLISHALLETGNGTSRLATGIMVNEVDGKPVPPRMVYNMFGIGANDHCATKCGSERAYQEGWFTPEDAIIGGAHYIARDYIARGQDTLYKMRWNPANPATHQYATDIGWAVKQVTNIARMYDDIISYDARFDVPEYKKQ